MNEREKKSIIDALESLARAISWTVPNDPPSVGENLNDAWKAIDRLKEGGTDNPKLCPWCGNEAGLVKMEFECDEMPFWAFWKVSCNDCHCIGANIHKWYRTKSEAIEAWNTRSTIEDGEYERKENEMSERAEKLRQVLDKLDIEHSDFDSGGRTKTIWQTTDAHIWYETAENPEKPAKLTISWSPTPGHEIAATFDVQPEQLIVKGDSE